MTKKPAKLIGSSLSENTDGQLAKLSEQEVDDLTDHFKSRIQLAVSDLVEPDGNDAAEIKQKVETALKSSNITSLLSKIGRGISSVNQEYGSTGSLNQFYLKYRLESFVYFYAKRGVFKINGDQIVVNKASIDSKILHQFQAGLSNIFKEMNIANQGTVSEYGKWEKIAMFEALKSIYRFFDENGQPIEDLQAYLGLERVSSFSQLDRIIHLNKNLEIRKARRLAITGRHATVPLDQVEQFSDPDHGYLCILDESGGFYRKITNHEAFNLAGLGQGKNEQLNELLVNPRVILRRSDISQLSYDYRALSNKNRTPMVNKLNYFFPSGKFIPNGSEEGIEINRSNDDFIVLSPDYSVLRMNRGNSKKYLLLKHLPHAELTLEQLSQIERNNGAIVPVAKTLSLTSVFDITDFIPVRSDESPKEYAKKVIKFADLDNLTNLYRTLFDQADFELQKFPLQDQLGFAVFYEASSGEQRKKIHTYLQQLGGDFFRAFQLCNHRLNLGQLIMNMVEKHGEKVRDLLVYINAILELDKQKEKIANPDHGIDSERFHTVIARKAEDFIRDAAKLEVGADLRKFLMDSEQYHLPVIATGAEFASKAQKEVKVPLSAAELAKALLNTNIENLPAGELVESIDPIRLFDPKNYIHPELFNENDARMIAENLDRAYSKIDPEWLIYLKTNILKDLNNPTVTFVAIRDKLTKRLLGVAKTRPADAEGSEYYIGTMYVDKAFQSQYNFGDYLQSMAENNIPDNLPYWGSAAVSNPAISRHIDHAGATASAIVFEGDEKHHSKELFKLNFRKNPNWKTKNHRLFPKDKIVSIADGKKQLESEYGETVKILKTSILPAGERELINLVQPYFQDGWHITRYFQAESASEKGKPYLYLALEKLQTDQSDLPSSQRAA